MDKLSMETKDLSQTHIEKIKELFPNAVTEITDDNGNNKLAIDFDVLKQELSNDLIDDKRERYQMTWPDKKKSILLANSKINATLRPNKQKSVNFDNTENIYIEGDNLDVLKLLREAYLNKIKMIYIDPPYNTGNDFVYNDDFSVKKDDYLLSSGQYDDQGNRMEKNLDSNGRFHTDWLNMIYPRLKIARDLLSEDGVIFISIDDHEQANLKKICDEIFGFNNVEVLIWNKEAEGSSGTLKQTSSTRRIHEYIICAFKNYNLIQFNKVHEALKGRENDFQTANLAVNIENEKVNHPNYFTIVNPLGDSFTRQWKWNKKEIDNLIKENLIYWGSDGHKQPRLIIPTDERRTTFLLSILNYGGTTVGRKDFEDLMGTEIEFSYPKPVILLKKLILTSTNKNDIILDFFSGSASTAHAVIQANAEDNSRRKYIMVQLPEYCDEKSEAFKAGYKTICDIGEERIRRIGKKILKENPNTRDLDVGFRVLELDSSNMNDVYYSPKVMQQSLLDSTVDNIKADRTSEDLLFQVMISLGIDLNSKIDKKNISNKNYFCVNDNDIIACFDDDLNNDILIEIAKLHPIYAVFKDKSFSSDSVGINNEQIFKMYSPNTEIKII